MAASRSVSMGIAASMMVLFISSSASAAPRCDDLPISKFRVLAQQAGGIEEYVISRSEMDRVAVRLDVSTAERELHPLMLMSADIDAHVAIQPVEAGNSQALSSCDAPISVVVAFGAVKWKVYLLQQAATDACVKHALLDHYAEHSRALDRQVQLFIHQRRKEIGVRLRDLKQSTAADGASTNKAFEAGLWSIVRDIVEDFKHDMAEERPRIREEIDSPEKLHRLRSACGGRVREIEEKFQGNHRDEVTIIWLDKPPRSELVELATNGADHVLRRYPYEPDFYWDRVRQLGGGLGCRIPASLERCKMRLGACFDPAGGNGDHGIFNTCLGNPPRKLGVFSAQSKCSA